MIVEFGFQNRYGFFIAFADSALDRILYVMIFAKLIAVKKSWSNAKTAKTFFDTISSFLSLIFSHTNIIAYAINNVRLLGTAGRVGTFGLDPINAWGENTSTFSEAILSNQVISVNQESPSL
jgi:Na+/H+-dicarboxylate symporter